ncbi:hypothetical protein HPB48_020815 [Haemaphysalis longicornis]|uniref:CSD domain-containing protein n=1 Tax=Haemaphysalis longicornis TaxID=44386 RepID=A0A9J6GRE0_HAELO|nr:hypothetical protein HPB48_020815 [Haemaphysalis longicornis]
MPSASLSLCGLVDTSTLRTERHGPRGEEDDNAEDLLASVRGGGRGGSIPKPREAAELCRPASDFSFILGDRLAQGQPLIHGCGIASRTQLECEDRARIAARKTAMNVAGKSKTKTAVATRVQGTRWIIVKNVHRFNNRHDNHLDVFVHHSAIKRNNPKLLRSVGDGQAVEFRRGGRPEGPRGGQCDRSLQSARKGKPVVSTAPQGTAGSP